MRDYIYISPILLLIYCAYFSERQLGFLPLFFITSAISAFYCFLCIQNLVRIAVTYIDLTINPHVCPESRNFSHPTTLRSREPPQGWNDTVPEPTATQDNNIVEEF